jgi:threonine-phosphate decarboxylase
MGKLMFQHGGNIYRAQEMYKGKIIDFSANINPLGLPKGVRREVIDNFASVLHYPDPEAKGIKAKIAQYWEIGEENILVGNGSLEFIYLVMLTYRPRRVLIPSPTFSEYNRAVRQFGGIPQFLNLRKREGFRLNLDSLSQFGEVEAVFICNPNNPTGNLLLEEPSQLRNLLGKLIVIDEAFIDFLPKEKDYTVIWKATRNKGLVVLRTFTKLFALPGLRIGYLVAHKETVSKLKNHQLCWNVNTFAQMASATALSARQYIRNTRRFVEKERRFLFENISRIRGLRPYPSVANFLLLRIEKNGMIAGSLTERLLERGILIRDCSNFRSLGNTFVRIAVRSRKENLHLLTHLREVLE